MNFDLTIDNGRVWTAVGMSIDTDWIDIWDFDNIPDCVLYFGICGCQFSKN